MPILPNRIYRGRIIRAKLERIEKQDGGVTSNLKVRIECDGAGDKSNCIDHQLYFTPNALTQTKKVLGELNSEIWEGMYPFLLRDPAKYLVGCDCRVETELHEFQTSNGAVEQSVRVKWLNGVNAGKPATEDDIARILGMMGVDDNYVATVQPVAEVVAADDDTPF